MRRKGFTLIELIVVIAIIAILAAIIAPNAFKAIEKSKTSATIGELTTFKTAALSYFGDVGAYPATCANTAACVALAPGFIANSAPITAGWDGPYLQKWPAVSKFAGSYTWTNAAGAIFGANAGERYITVTGAGINLAVQNAVNRAIDGGTNLAGGDLRITAAAVAPNLDLLYLISRDLATTAE